MKPLLLYFMRICVVLALLPVLALVLDGCKRGNTIPDGVNVQLVGSGFAVGGDIEVRLTIGGLPGGAGGALSGFDVNILFDSAVLALKSSSFTDFASEVNQLDHVEEGAMPFKGGVADSGGVIDAFGVSGNSGAVLESEQADEFVFLTLVFTAAAPAQDTAVSLNVSDPGLLFADSANAAMTQTFANTSVSFDIASP